MTTAISTTDKTLTKPEASRLVKLEETIRSGMVSYFETGAALQEIRESRLYRGAFSRFEDYCKSRWNFSRQHVNRVIAACEVRKSLEPMGSIPENERQVRPLIGLEPEQQKKAWSQAIERAPEVDGEKHITAKLVSTVVNEMKKPQPAADDADEDIEPEKLPLAVALQKLNDAVIELREQWPEDELKALVVKLRRLADEIEEELAE